MKIENLNNKFEEKNIDEANFDIEKWRVENPIDYYKLTSILLNAPNVSNLIPHEIALARAFDTIYQIIRLHIPNTLFKYYSLTDNNELNEKKIETLANNLIYMSCIKDFNDPFDGKAFFYNPKSLNSIKRLRKCKGKIIDDFTDFNRGTSFTANDMNCMPMWAHYSNNHHGFCVAYDMKDPRNKVLSSCTFPVQYTNERLDITSYMKTYVEMIDAQINRESKMGIKQHIIKDLSLIYLSTYLCNIKHSTWSYEKEFRCTMGAKAKGMPYTEAYPNAIYVGINCSKENQKKLVNIAKKIEVPIYKMEFNELSESYKFGLKKLYGGKKHDRK